MKISLHTHIFYFALLIQGINYVTRFMDYIATQRDFWHVFELGGTTLSKTVFDIKGEFYKGERLYGVSVKVD